MSTTVFLPCLDSEAAAHTLRWQLDLSRDQAAALGRSAVDAADKGSYTARNGEQVNWQPLVDRARFAKCSIPPDEALAPATPGAARSTEVQVTNETTLQASLRLTDADTCPLALNFASGVNPGGGFLRGARAQEEALCRSSALHATLVDDPMYAFHAARTRPDATDWAIISPDVPVFRTDDGIELAEPWLLSFVSCAAPYAPSVGQPESGDLLRRRILRVLAIATSFGYRTLVLGAWGCGAFGNDPKRTAADFRSALEGPFAGHFDHVAFAITDWSPERRFLGPFRDTFR